MTALCETIYNKIVMCLFIFCQSFYNPSKCKISSTRQSFFVYFCRIGHLIIIIITSQEIDCAKCDIKYFKITFANLHLMDIKRRCILHRTTEVEKYYNPNERAFSLFIYVLCTNGHTKSNRMYTIYSNKFI